MSPETQVFFEIAKTLIGFGGFVVVLLINNRILRLEIALKEWALKTFELKRERHHA